MPTGSEKLTCAFMSFGMQAHHAISSPRKLL